MVHPTLSLVDLISDGITETPTEPNEIVHDREFCQKMLQATAAPLHRLSTPQKDTLARSLRRYIRRIENYRLCFDVNISDGFRAGERRMTKEYKTRWNSSGRVNKSFARYNQALEWGFENHENAVFATLTTDPKQFDNLAEAWDAINENFHRLTQFLKSDPESVSDTRRENVPGWTFDRDSRHFHFGREGAVSGRPRKRLEYLKVLESTSAGYPHLHVMFFGVPTRDKDGMPWLIDKKELVQKWGHDYGQGVVLDLYPLTRRDDLDVLGNFGYDLVHDSEGNIVRDANGGPKRTPIEEGYVCWYRYGDNDFTEEEIQERTRYHREKGLIDMEGADENPQQKTAGAYLGKYLSEMYNALHDRSLKFENGSWDHDNDSKMSWWKLAMYWTMNKRFWTISQGIEDAIRLDDSTAPEIARATRWATKLSIRDSARAEIDDDARIPDFSDEKLDSSAARIVRETWAEIDYLGAYHYDDLPWQTQVANPLEALEIEAYRPDSGIKLRSRGDRPPPMADVWS